MKKITALVAAICLLLLCLTACGKAQVEEVTGDDADTAVAEAVPEPELDPLTAMAEEIMSFENAGSFNSDGATGYYVLYNGEDFSDEVLSAVIQAGYSVKRIGAEDTGGSAEAAEKLMAKYLPIYGYDLELIICSDESTALGATSAAEAAGRCIGQDINIIYLG